MPFCRHQGIMGAGFDHPAAIHDHQSVGLAQRGQAVGDGDGGPTAHQIVERLLDFLLGFRVDRRRGFVENEDFRVDQ